MKRHKQLASQRSARWAVMESVGLPVTPPCLGCGHAQRNHINGVGLCCVASCHLCLSYRPGTTETDASGGPLPADVLTTQEGVAR